MIVLSSIPALVLFAGAMLLAWLHRRGKRPMLWGLGGMLLYALLLLLTLAEGGSLHEALAYLLPILCLLLRERRTA